MSAMVIAMAGIGATSCSNEAELMQEVPVGETTHMTLTVSKEDFDDATRATFADEDDNLKFTWEETDQIEVRGKVNGTTDKRLGILQITPGSINGTKCEFSGDGIEILGKEAEYHFFYLANGETGETDNTYSISLPGNDFTLAGLAGKDIQKAKATLKYAGGLSGTISLKRPFAFATVTITLPEGVKTPSAGVDVTFSGDGISSTAQVSLTDASAAVTNTATTSSDVTLKMDGNVNSQKFYMNILPGTLSNLKVTTEINGKTYSAEKLTDSSKATVANTNYDIAFTMEEEEEDTSIKWVDLGLSVLWADRNLGASSPEGVGDFYCYAGTEPDKASTNWYFDDIQDNTIINYNDYRYPEDKEVFDNLKYLKYFQTNNYNWYYYWSIQGTNADAISVKYDDGSFHTPNEGNLAELFRNCDFEWTTQKGVNGYKVIGTNGNSIFLPCTGIKATRKASITLDTNVILRTTLCWCNDGSSIFLFMNNQNNTKGNVVLVNNTYGTYSPIRGVKEK